MPIRRKNEHYRSREYLTVREVNSILRAAKVYGRHRKRNYALVLLIFRHGLRVSEACDLRWDAISFLDIVTRRALLVLELELLVLEVEFLILGLAFS